MSKPAILLHDTGCFEKLGRTHADRIVNLAGIFLADLPEFAGPLCLCRLCPVHMDKPTLRFVEHDQGGSRCQGKLGAVRHELRDGSI